MHVRSYAVGFGKLYDMHLMNPIVLVRNVQVLILHHLSSPTITVNLAVMQLLMDFMDQTHSGMVVVAQLVMIDALHLEHHGSTVTSLNLRRELLK